MGRDTADHTPSFKVRMPRAMWDAYGRVCERMGTDRSEDVIDRVRQRIEQHGDETDRAALSAAEAELAERRARKGGRPRKSRPDAVNSGGGEGPGAT